jgi:hypothetical protein
MKYLIAKEVVLKTVNEGLDTDNVLVLDQNNIIKQVPRSEFDGGTTPSNYKSYVATFTIEAGIPIPVVRENTLGENIVWETLITGLYTMSIPDGLFGGNYTVAITDYFTQPFGKTEWISEDNSTIKIVHRDMATGDFMTPTSPILVEVKVYN